MGHKEKMEVVENEVKNKGGEHVDLFPTFHSGLLRGGICMVWV